MSSNKKEISTDVIINKLKILKLVDSGNEGKELVNRIEIPRVAKFLAEDMNWEMISQMNDTLKKHIKPERRTFVLYYFLLQRFEYSFLGYDLLIPENWELFTFLDKLPQFSMKGKDLSSLTKKIISSSKLTNLLDEIFEGLKSFKDPWGTLLDSANQSDSNEEDQPQPLLSFLSFIPSQPVQPGFPSSSNVVSGASNSSSVRPGLPFSSSFPYPSSSNVFSGASNSSSVGPGLPFSSSLPYPSNLSNNMSLSSGSEINFWSNPSNNLFSASGSTNSGQMKFQTPPQEKFYKK